MAAGRMYLAKAYRKPARKYKKASGFRKTVTAIAKKAIMTQSETKTGAFEQNAAFGVNGILQPVWNSIAQGDGQNNRDGDEIHALGVKLRGYVGQDTTIITGLRDANAVRMIVASGKRPLTSGDFPTFNGTIDSEVLTVLSDSYIQFDTTKTLRYFQKYIKFPRKVLYQGAAVNKNELNVWLVPFGGTGLTTTLGNVVRLTYQMYFKDL